MHQTMTRLLICAAGVVLLTTSISCGRSAGNSATKPTAELACATGLAEVTHRFPVSAAAEAPVIAADEQDRIFVAWATETDDDALTLFLARSTDDGATFESPRPFRKVPIYRFTRKGRTGERTFSTHVLPRLVTTPAGLFLGWVEALDGGPEVKYFIAKSVDGGQTFSEPVAVHSDASLRPGFTAVSAGPDGNILSAWLDGRNKSQQPFVSTSNEAGSEFHAEQMVYAGPQGSGVCPCCNLAICASRDGATFVAFRNADEGNRDIWIARSPANSKGYEPPQPVSPNHWSIDGCPHDGPALSIADDNLHVVWMDAHSGRNRVYYTSAEPTTLDFAPAQEVSPESPGEQGHPQLALDHPGTLHAVWDESTSASVNAPANQATASQASEHHHHGTPTGVSRAIKYARLCSGAAGFEPAQPIALRSDTIQTHPSLIVAPSGRVFIVWKESSEMSKSVVVARLAK